MESLLQLHFTSRNPAPTFAYQFGIQCELSYLPLKHSHYYHWKYCSLNAFLKRGVDVLPGSLSASYLREFDNQSSLHPCTVFHLHLAVCRPSMFRGTLQQGMEETTKECEYIPPQSSPRSRQQPPRHLVGAQWLCSISTGTCRVQAVLGGDKADWLCPSI